MHTLLKLGWHIKGLSVTVELNGLLDVVDDHLTRIAVRQMLFESLAHCRIDVAVDILIQCFQQFFAFHGLPRIYTD